MAPPDIDTLKSELYLGIQVKTWDTEIQSLLDAVTARAISFLDRDIAAIDISQYPDIENAIYKQAAYEWRRRKDIGLNSVSYPDGNISKYQSDEWLDEVKQTLQRYWRIEI